MEVSMTSLCFDYRDNVLFWVFLFKLNSTDALIDFASSCPNNKITKNVIKKILAVKESIRKQGQFTPVFVIVKEKRLYHIYGTKRLVSHILLEKKNVIICIDKKCSLESTRDYSLTTKRKYFQNVSIEMLAKYKKWKQSFIEKGFYYE